MLTDVLVPGNRWDLLEPYPTPRPRVSVVVVHYEQPVQLARTWAALCAQTMPPVEVVIADDGSPPASLPLLPAGGPPVRVVTQPDCGFRAAAARNLGVRHTTGEVLVFLDADTVPEPGFLEALTGRVARCPDVLAVGRRRHADLSGLPPGAAPATAPELPEPGWLRDGYTASRDLLDADGRSFRFVISAVLACRRSLFDDLGGFDERFVGYGGEDWDLAYRAWNAGAVLVHERDAVAWHDGPDWAGRPTERARKNLESARLAALIPEPGTRAESPVVADVDVVPDVLVDVAPGLSAADSARVVRSLLRQDHRDLQIRLPVPSGPGLVVSPARGARTAAWSCDERRRARVRIEVARPLPPCAVTDVVATMVDRDVATAVVRTGGTRAGTAVAGRAEGRARRWAGRFSAAEVYGAAFTPTEIEVGTVA